MTFKAIAQLFTLGCSWGLGFFMVNEVGKTIGLIIAYMFTIINVLQGVLLFVVHCLLNRQVKLIILSPNLIEWFVHFSSFSGRLYFEAALILGRKFRCRLGLPCGLSFIRILPFSI